MTPLLRAFTDPGLLAHRGLHGDGRPENALSAFRAAADAGYGVELDVQPSADGVAMAFHDATLDRMTARTGPIDALDAGALRATPLHGGGGEGIPTLAAALDAVAGRTPVLIEVKDRDGAMGPDVGALEAAVADAVRGYDGPVAVMSFNPHSVAAFARLLPDVPRGLTTARFDTGHWPTLPDDTRARLAKLTDAEAVGASFVSHQADALDMASVRAFRARGRPVLCWTIRTADQARAVRPYADAITFEGFRP